MRTRSPRGTPPLDSPRSLSCPFSWPLPPKVFRKAPGSGLCWRWCRPGPSHVLLPAGLFLRCESRFGHPLPRRAKRWASKMPTLVLGGQRSQPQRGDRQPAPSQPRVAGALAGGSFIHPVHVLAFPPELVGARGRRRGGEGPSRVQGSGEGTPAGMWKAWGPAGRWPAPGASVAD